MHLVAAVLIVEPHSVLGGLLAKNIQNLQCQVHRVNSVEAALECLETASYDVMVVDQELPDGDGLQLLTHVSRSPRPTRTMMISNRYQVADRVAGFVAGADDYLVKPFAWDECMWRVRKLLHLEKPKPPTAVRVGQILFYPETGVMEAANRTLVLRRREAQVFWCLCRYKNQVVTRERLVNEVWGNHAVVPSDVTIEVYMRRLRMKLGNSASMLQTVRGLGYILRED